MSFELVPLSYDYDALSPYMSRETFEYHRDKHHQTYINNMNELLQESVLKDESIETIVKESFTTNITLFNNAAQHYNHHHFWKWIKKGGGGRKLPEKISRLVDSDLGGYDKFRADFINAAVTQFGSGWAWLAVRDGKLEISKTSNAKNPLIYGAKPILGVDVWEHTYYIDYRNMRLKFLEAFVDHLINWDYVLEMYESI